MLVWETRTIFNYDEIFGTVINRFVVQAIAGVPLTCYGKGGQTRGYLNIRDTMQCVYLAALKPAARGELRIFNQIMETFTVNELADLAQKVGLKLGYDVKVDHVPNPRKEKEEHYYNPKYSGLRELGVKPHLLTEEVMTQMFQVARAHVTSVRLDTFVRGVRW